MVRKLGKGLIPAGKKITRSRKLTKKKTDAGIQCLWFSGHINKIVDDDILEDIV